MSGSANTNLYVRVLKSYAAELVKRERKKLSLSIYKLLLVVRKCLLTQPTDVHQNGPLGAPECISAFVFIFHDINFSVEV